MRYRSGGSQLRRRQYFCFGVFRAAVQMHAKLDARNMFFHLAVKIADKFRRSGTDGIRK